MRNWNAKIGADVASSSNIGKYRIGNTSDCGLKLLDLAVKNNLKIAASFFKKLATKNGLGYSLTVEQEMK